MSNNGKLKVVTFAFNFAFFIYIIFASFMTFLFEPESAERVPMDAFYDIAPVTSVIVAVLIGIILILTGALIIKEFWNRLISNLFSVRDINYQESLTIMLIIGMFTF